MRQKYMVSRNADKKQVVIKEYAELDKDMYSLLCEETYDEQDIESAMPRGLEAIVGVIRTQNFYPPGGSAERIAEGVVSLFQSDLEEVVEIMVDDLEVLAHERDLLEMEAEIGPEGEEDLDDLLEDNLDEDFDDDSDIKNVSSIKVADDDTLDLEDDT